MRFYLSFNSDDYGKKEVDEPFGTDDIKFSLKQKTDNGMMARDISFSGGEIQFEFTHTRNHELKQLLYYHKRYGYESKVELTIEIDSLNKYTCDLDFATAETDDLEYFRCKGIEDSKLQIIKSRKSVKVDLLSDISIDGDYIEPLVPDNILLLAKPVIQTSKWEESEPETGRLKNVVEYFNPCLQILKYDIEGTVNPFSSESFNSEHFEYLVAENTLTKINVLLKDIDVLIPAFTGGGAGGDFNIKILVVAGNLETNTTTFSKTLLDHTQSSTIEYHLVQDLYEVEVPILQRGERLYIYFRLQYNSNSFNPFYHTISLKNIDINVQSTAYNSISKSLRLIDVMAQVIKSISGLSISAPRFALLGQFYDNRLLDGNFLRGIIDKGFKVSLEDIEKSLPEIKGDYEIGSDGKIFFGIEQDFYTQTESGFFDDTQFSEMKKTFNPKYSVNEFNYIYANYQSLKENEEPNSADTIHGESRFVFFNKNVENKKEAKVQWTRDAFLIEATRRKALEITENTASQDDDTLFIIDSIDTTHDTTFTEVTNLQHTFDVANSRLSLRNDGSVNFISLGIIAGSIFTIQPVDLNAGTYSVFSVTNNSLELTRLLGMNTSAGNGERSTKYTYTLDQSTVPFTNYTNQGFTETENLNAPDSYSNRRYSIARNINNYWNSYLATCNLYWKEQPIKNTWYKNNGNYTSNYNNIKLTEKDNIIPTNPILTPILYNNIVFANVEFSDFIILQNNIRSQRGYIRSIDNNQQVIKIYPIDMEYSLLEKELIIKGEEKYEPVNMSISTEFDYVLINNETRVNSLKWEITNEKLYIYDENSYSLYNGVYWFEVSVNGAIPISIEQLENWLSLVN
jgi:hypothetical protein